ncbi:MAG: tRNA 4-thiouridine(8) synthase ThiI [Mollicutes bacterium]|nr:tRNA 4-thiouridine(8) synthase ThiI [Mollicutes bacterium]
MEKVIIIKYAELSTKNDNINFFLRTLKNNITNKLEGLDFSITYDYGRMVIETSSLELVLNRLQEVFGIHEICVGYKLNDKDLDIIKNKILFLIKDKTFETFRVTVKRSDKKYPGTSVEIAKEIGAHILKNTNNKKVLMTNVDLNVFVEIRLNDVFVYFNGIPGLGGYPISTLGKGLLMLSGGIDSPVAGYLAIKRGVKIEAIYFDSPPHTSQMAFNKVKDLARKLSLYNGTVKIHVINFTKIQEEILKKIPKYYLITMMRRAMYQISAIVASKINAHVIINGECIGQVASQTLKSMKVINECIKIPVIRPVCTYDKLEIIALAKKIDTYNISIRPYADCCTIFVPEHPVIHPDLKLVHEYEKLVDFKALFYEAIKTRKIFEISENDKNDFQGIL